MMSFYFLNPYTDFIAYLFVILFTDAALSSMLRHHIPLVRSLFHLIISFLFPSDVMMIFSLASCAFMPLSHNFSSDINDLSFMARNMWHDLSYEDSLFIFNYALWLDCMVSPLGSDYFTTLVQVVTCATFALLAA